MQKNADMIAIDPHAHIVSERFIEDVRAGKFGPALSIEQGSKWDLLVTKTTVLSETRLERNPLPRETYDVDLYLCLEAYGQQFWYPSWRT